MVYGGGLENRFPSNRDGGSNPSPSAILLPLQPVHNGLAFTLVRALLLVSPFARFSEASGGIPWQRLGVTT